MSHFFAVLSRMKHIRRWGLMRCTREENLYEHSYETAVLAHALALLRNQRFGGRVSPERAAALGDALLGERDRQLHKFVFRTVHVFDL